MEPANNEVSNPLQEPQYHTISGGPETVQEKVAEQLQEQKSAPAHQIINQVQQNTTPVVQQSNSQEVVESFLDRHIMATVVIINSFLALCIIFNIKELAYYTIPN